MNPEYLPLTDTIQLLTLFVGGPVVAVVIAYRESRKKPPHSNSEENIVRCAIFGILGLLLFGFAKWLNADVRDVIYLLQLASVLLSGLLFGAFMGYGLLAFLRLWRWHQATRLKESASSRTDASNS